MKQKLVLISASLSPGYERCNPTITSSNVRASSGFVTLIGVSLSTSCQKSNSESGGSPHMRIYFFTGYLVPSTLELAGCCSSGVGILRPFHMFSFSLRTSTRFARLVYLINSGRTHLVLPCVIASRSCSPGSAVPAKSPSKPSSKPGPS